MAIKKVVSGRPERFAFGSIVDALSKGLYPNKEHIVREFVQNSRDALAALRRVDASHPLKPIQIKFDGSTLTIGDHGLGMTETQAREYRYLGYSEKQKGTDAGFRGIGKFSAVSICSRIIMDTTRLGSNKRYQVTVDADSMRATLKSNNNTPLEDLLQNHTKIQKSSARPDEHYTFVVLDGIKTEARNQMESTKLGSYLSRTAPLKFNPSFTFASDIEDILLKNVPDYLALELLLDGNPIYKPFLSPCQRPEKHFIWSEKRQELIAVGWSCANVNKYQFRNAKDQSGELTDTTSNSHPDSGMVFRVKNIAVGDRFLPRKTFWKVSPELSFHYYGEIHVLNASVIPSSDRTDFEDDEARKELYDGCSKEVARNLNLQRRAESEERNFKKAVDGSGNTVRETEEDLRKNSLPIELRQEAAFKVRKAIENISKRVQLAEKKLSSQVKQTNKSLRLTTTNAKQILKRAQALLTKLESPDGGTAGFEDIASLVKLDASSRYIYNTILKVLKEEFSAEPAKLEKIIRKIHSALLTTPS